MSWHIRRRVGPKTAIALTLVVCLVVHLLYPLIIYRVVYRKTILPSPTEQSKKLISMATSTDVTSSMDFDRCEFSNCEWRLFESGRYYAEADVVVFDYRYFHWYTPMSNFPRTTTQLWMLFSLESPVGWKFVWTPWFSDDIRFNATMTFRTDSDIYYPYGGYKVAAGSAQAEKQDYGYKTDGAFAYVSNCHSAHYDRLGAMETLGKYIPVDIFGSCTNKRPCPGRASIGCETERHRQYRFFLSFENALCKDYITEKFWGRLMSDGHFVPVVIGGLSLDDYTKAAPPNSFIHADNFTSLEALGLYLRRLMRDDRAYSRYHEWRADYQVFVYNPALAGVPCRLCELANKKPSMPGRTNLSQWYSPTSFCRKKLYV